MNQRDQVVDLIGKKHFEWLSKEFDSATTLKDIPKEIIDRIASVDITIRDYTSDVNTITSIAVITFAYKTAEKVQKVQFGVKDILLLKILAKHEKLRRNGKRESTHRRWDAPLCELITGKVGEHIRAMRTMNSPT